MSQEFQFKGPKLNKDEANKNGMFSTKSSIRVRPITAAPSENTEGCTSTNH